MKNWYAWINNTQYGPYSWEELVRYTKEGRIQKTDYVWNPEYRGWISVDKVPGLLGAAENRQKAVPPIPTDFPASRGKKRRMVAVALFIVLLLLAATCFVGPRLLYTSVLSSYKLSEAQQHVADTLGPPSQFILSYIPRGPEENMELVRGEVWYYPDLCYQVTFMEGVIVSVEETDVQEQSTEGTGLRPGDFDFSMGYEETAACIGGDIELFDLELDIFDQSDLQVYLSEKALFAIEQGRLVYLQTFGWEGS
jgi:hypothetical protein